MGQIDIVIIEREGKRATKFCVYELAEDDIVEWRTRVGIRRGRVIEIRERTADGAIRNRPIRIRVINKENEPDGNEFTLGRYAFATVYDSRGTRKQPK